MAGVGYNLGRGTVAMAVQSRTHSGLCASDLLGVEKMAQQRGPESDKHGMGLRKGAGGQTPGNVAISLAGWSFTHSDWPDLGLSGRSLLGLVSGLNSRVGD